MVGRKIVGGFLNIWILIERVLVAFFKGCGRRVGVVRVCFLFKDLWLSFVNYVVADFI